MKKPKKDPIREDRIHNEAIVDAYGPEEQALGWYYYLENKIRFPFQAKCVAAKVISPLLKGETVEVRRLAPERGLLQRYARADPVARPERGRSLVSTDSSRRRPINRRGHWRLALLGGARLPVLSSCRPAPSIMLRWVESNRHMTRRQSKSQPTWVDVKAKLANFDRTGLLSLVQDLYAAHKDNQAFLHARLGLGEDILKPYKQTIDRWLWPDVFGKQDTSVAQAKQAISHYKKAVGEPAGLAELMVFYCERAAGFCNDVGYDDENYFTALVRTFEQALTIANTLPTQSRDALLARLDRVRNISRNFGYGVVDAMDDIFAKHM
jgi:hypothetical protein